jgi:xylan 1,4-beta-xylosidase
LKKTRLTVGDKTPLYYTEYDDGYNDATSYGAAFVIYQNYVNHGVVDILSWWVFSDIFEEAGMRPDPFNKVWMPVDGLMNVYGIPKPNYRAFQLLHWSGNKLVDTQPNTFHTNDATVSAFTVIGNDTSIFIVNWNIKKIPVENATVTVTVKGSTATKAIIYRIDDTNGNAFPLWMKMGSPTYLNQNQVNALNNASELVSKNLLVTIKDNTIVFDVTVPANTVVNVILK